MNDQSNKKIAIIGKENVISCFKFAGFETFFVNDANECLSALENIKTDHEQYAIAYLTENFYDQLSSDINLISQKLSIPITLIPDNTGSKNKALDMLSKTIEQATGSDLLSKS